MQPPRRPFLAALAEGALFTAILSLPLFLQVATDSVFEPDKAALLRALACLAGAAGLAALFRSGRSGRAAAATWLRGPIPAAATLVLALELAATLSSVAPWRSLFGAPSRGQGLLTTAGLWVMLGAAAWACAWPRGPARLATAIGATLLPAGLYGIAQSYGLDPLPWTGDVIGRVTGPAGASVMLASGLILALPFAGLAASEAWQRSRAAPEELRATLELAAWSLAIAVGLWALALTRARGAALGLAAGLGLAALATLARRGRRRAALALLALGAAAAAAILLLNARPELAGPVARLPVLDRLSTALDPADTTTRVRLRLWLGSVEALAAEPARLPLGRGPETMDLSWAPFAPAILAHDEPRGWLADRAHTLGLDTLLGTGLAGLAARLVLAATVLASCLRRLGLATARRDQGGCLATCALGALTGLLAGRAAALPLRPYLEGAALPDWQAPHAWLVAAPAAGLGALAGLALWLALRAGRAAAPLGPATTRDGPPAGAQGGRAAGAEDWAATDPSPAGPPAPATGAGFALAALAALGAHWAELQVGFPITVSRILVWTIVGALAGLDWRERREAVKAIETVSRAPAPGPDFAFPLLPLVAGITLLFAWARAGLTHLGAPTALALVAVSVLGTALMAGPARRGAWPRRPLRLAALLAAYALGQILLLRLGSRGEADGIPAMAAGLAWYGSWIFGLVLAHARSEAGAWPRGRSARIGALALLPAAALGAWLLLAPSLAAALVKEGRVGWQSHAQGLRMTGEGGRAESFLLRARERYRRAARLAPWEAGHPLALARVESEWADLLDARLSRALAEAGLAETADEYDPTLLDGAAAALATERDAHFAAALTAIDRAERLNPGAPDPILTRARSLRLWADRSRATALRAERFARAREAYAEAARRAPRWPEVLDEAAATAILSDDPEAALRLSERAAEIDPYYRRSWRTAAGAWAALGNPAAAAEAYGRYFGDARNAADLPALRAWLSALMTDGQDELALAVGRDIVWLAPGDPHARADLALLLHRTGAPAAALAEARRAARLAPADPAIAALLRDLEDGAGLE